jgi:hypothetical protein
VVPITIGGGMALVGKNVGFMDMLMMINATWLPIFNSSATLILLPPYRRLLVRLLTTGGFFLDAKTHPFMVNTSKDPVRRYRPWENYSDQRHSIVEGFNQHN